MVNEILLSEYSYHTEKKIFNWKSGLDYFFIRLQTEGQCYARINGNILKVSAGDLLLCKPGDQCELIVDEYIDQTGKNTVSSGDYYLMCKGPWLDEWWNRRDRQTLQHIKNDRKLLILWKEISLEKRRIYEKDEEFLDYLLRALCLSIDNALKESNPDNQTIPKPALTMKTYIEEHATRSLKVREVADHVGFSISRASHLFKEAFGKTIIQYGLEIRLNTALKYMEYSDMPMEQIAEISGFGSYTYFYRVFRKVYGVSPSQYTFEEMD